MTNDWDAWMEEEFDVRDPDRPGSADGLGRVRLGGGAAAVLGAAVAFSAAAPLSLAGWILLAVGLALLWEGSR